MKILVITISDRAYQGIYEDKSGNIIAEVMSKYYKDSEIKKIIIADEYDIILKTLKENKSLYNIIITTGGTGISKRDVTPEATKAFITKEVPGIQEYMRMESMKETIFSCLSRGVAGINDNVFVINFPGSEKAASLYAKLTAPILSHIIDMMNGLGHK